MGIFKFRALRSVRDSKGLIHFKVCMSVYRIYRNRTIGKYEYGTILQLIIQLINFKICSCIYSICRNRTWGKYEYGTILQLIIELIYFKVCSCIYRICSDRTWGKYEYGTLLKLTFCRSYLNHYCMGRKTAFFSGHLNLRTATKQVCLPEKKTIITIKLKITEL